MTVNVSALRAGRRQIKCLVWDLDETLWTGTLLEGDAVSVRPQAAVAIRELDRRGILHSIASRNEGAAASAVLKREGLEEYFVHPQITWSPKSRSVAQIAQHLNIGLDAIAFVDDQAFERDEVAAVHPEVLCLSAEEIDTIIDRLEFVPVVISDDAKLRRKRYFAEADRKSAEEAFDGTPQEFLGTLDLVCTIRRACLADLDRALELTLRTHQLNSTGFTCSREELAEMFVSSSVECLTATLEDRYGDYGAVGLSVTTLTSELAVLRLLLTSCRVISRGVGTLMLNHVMRRAQASGRALQAQFIPTERNRMMRVTFAFAGFREVARRGEVCVLAHDLVSIPTPPAYCTLLTDADEPADTSESGGRPQ